MQTQTPTSHAIEIRQEGAYAFVEMGTGPTLLLLHGLFGALSNWSSLLRLFSSTHRVVIPLLPIYIETPVPPSVDGLVEYLRGFIKQRQMTDFTLIGNSLGGHLALFLALQYPTQVNALVLTGSSGLFEEGMGSGFPRRGDYKYIRERVEFTFFNPATATDELVNEVFSIVNDNAKAMRVLRIARAAQRMNMGKDLMRIHQPTCLVWGLNDNITPARVAHEFRRLMPNAELNFIDGCGHAAMMEQPARFNEIVADFLHRHTHIPQ